MKHSLRDVSGAAPPGRLYNELERTGDAPAGRLYNELTVTGVATICEFWRASHNRTDGFAIAARESRLRCARAGTARVWPQEPPGRRRRAPRRRARRRWRAAT